MNESYQTILFLVSLVIAISVTQSISQSADQSVHYALILAAIECGKLIAAIILLRFPSNNPSFSLSTSQSIKLSIESESESDRDSLLSPRRVAPSPRPRSVHSDSEYRASKPAEQPKSYAIRYQSFVQLFLGVLTSVVCYQAGILIQVIGLIDCLIVCLVSFVTADIVTRHGIRSIIRTFKQSVSSSETWMLNMFAVAVLVINQSNNQAISQPFNLLIIQELMFFLSATFLLINLSISQSTNQSNYRFGLKSSNQLMFASAMLVDLAIVMIDPPTAQSIFNLFDARIVVFIVCSIFCSFCVLKQSIERAIHQSSFGIICALAISLTINQSFNQSINQVQCVVAAILLCSSYMRMSSDQSVNRQSTNPLITPSNRTNNILVIVCSVLLLLSLSSASPSINSSIEQPTDQQLTPNTELVQQILEQTLPMVTYQPPSQPSDFTMIIPSFHGHIDHLIKYLITMRTFCPECTRLPLLVVTGINEKPLFTARVKFNPDVGPFFSNLTFVTLPEITTLPWHIATNQTGYWQDRKCNDAKDGNKCIRDRHIHQSLKKMYGCLAAQTRYCWASDSESLFIRPITVKELLQDYIDQPKIITSTWLREHYSASDAARLVLGINSRFGWFLEYYMWVFDRSIFGEVEQVIKRRFPRLDDFPEGLEVFIEVAYYAYIYHHQRRFPQYEILDTPDMFGTNWWHEFSQKYPGWSWGVIEDIRIVYDERPELRPGVDAMFAKYDLKAYKSHQGEQQCNTFVDANPGVVLLLSDQPGNVFEAALKSRYLLPHHVGYENRTAFKQGDEKK